MLNVRTEITPALAELLDHPTRPQRWAGSTRVGPSLMKRMLSGLRVEDDCWIIDLQPTQQYAIISILGRRYIRSRVMFYITNGRWPEGGVVRHTCDRKKCINPEHLVEGTVADNVHDAIERGGRKWGAQVKTHCLRGHARTPDNLTPTRNCKTCARDRARTHKRDRRKKP